MSEVESVMGVMTLGEAIRHAEEVAEENEKSLREWKECKNRGTAGWSDFDKEQVDMSITRCSKCAAEHRQLAEWLKDYKRLLEQEPCDDVISRDAVLDLCDSKDPEYRVIHLKEDVECLPSVQPQPKTGHCKDCRWWKDSDGIFRRGIDAESQCPMNRKEVYEGNGYCFMFEPQESEDKE